MPDKMSILLVECMYNCVDERGNFAPSVMWASSPEAKLRAVDSLG